jgi:hypothetical protein
LAETLSYNFGELELIQKKKMVFFTKEFLTQGDKGKIELKIIGAIIMNLENFGKKWCERHEESIEGEIEENLCKTSFVSSSPKIYLRFYEFWTSGAIRLNSEK